MARAVEERAQAGTRACRQQMPRGEPCSASVARVCDACGKEVCAGHVRRARADADAPGGQRWSREAEASIPEICITCCILEVVAGRERVEEIDDGVRESFYASEAAAGLLGPDEVAWLEARGLPLPDGRPLGR